MAQQMIHAVQSSTLADVLERVLDKGIVIAGDIKIKLVEIELLTIQIRLMIASVDKAREIGMDWWVKNPEFNSSVRNAQKNKEMERLENKVAVLERAFATNAGTRAQPQSPGAGRGGKSRPMARLPQSGEKPRTTRGRGTGSRERHAR